LACPSSVTVLAEKVTLNHIQPLKGHFFERVAKKAYIRATGASASAIRLKPFPTLNLSSPTEIKSHVAATIIPFSLLASTLLISSEKRLASSYGSLRSIPGRNGCHLRLDDKQYCAHFVRAAFEIVLEADVLLTVPLVSSVHPLPPMQIRFTPYTKLGRRQDFH
jgi:hypothetical protein